MDDQDALLALGAGDSDEKAAAAKTLFDRYHRKLVALLENRFYQDRDCANVGAGYAFAELFDQPARVLTKLLEKKKGEPWAWLVRRGIDRTKDARRAARRILSRVPDTQKDAVAREDLEDYTDSLAAHSGNPIQELEAREFRSSILAFLEDLEPLNRAILLHDFVVRRRVFPPNEIAEYDEELISRLFVDKIFTAEALAQQRSRLKQKLRTFLERRFS